MNAGSDRALPGCVAAFAGDERHGFNVTDAPANILKRNLETKYRVARKAGKVFEGDTDTLLGLTDLDEELVTGVSTDTGGAHFSAFFRSSTLELVGCVIMREPAEV